MRRRTFLFSLGVPNFLPAPLTRAADRSLGVIAFVQEGVLWVRELPNGQARRLNSGGQFHSPRFSPSGEWIACQSGEATYVLHGNDRSVRRLSPGVSAWIPGRDVLAVADEENFAFYGPMNGWSTPISVFKGAGLPIFSPDGAQFVYSRAIEKARGPAGEPMRDGQLCLGILGDSKREPRILTSKHLTNLLPHAWTRDAKSILYWDDPSFSASLIADGLELVLIDVVSGLSKPLAVTTLVHDDMISRSPTQNALAMTVGAGRETWAEKRIGILNLDKVALRYITDDKTSAICPSWSPDGKWIAYAASTAPPAQRIGIGGDQARVYLDKRRIWSADASTRAAPRQLTNDDRYRDEEPMWSADATHILFSRMDRNEAGTLWLMRADGGNPVQVAGRLALEDGWFGYYGYTEWRRTFDWFTGPQNSTFTPN